ncbi:MAG: N-formylglutamate amidohydrolase [Hyphomicrobium sp.]
MTAAATSAIIPQEFFPPFSVAHPAAQSVPFVFCSPHSGRVYPSTFLAQSRLTPKALRKSEDSLVDALFAPAVALGAPLIAARFPRAYLDLNREPYELDPELVAEPLPAHANTQSIRVAGGLGTVARVVADGEEIYRDRLSLAEVMARIDHLYRPFHVELTRLIEATRDTFGYAVLIDCHSMPSATTAPTGGPRPDIVIGDRFGASCDARLTRLVRNAFQDRGFDAQLNRPYAGGYITEHYGNPARAVHAVQIEINRGLYLDERSFEASAGYAELQAHLMAALTEIVSDAPGLFELRTAAE